RRWVSSHSRSIASLYGWKKSDKITNKAYCFAKGTDFLKVRGENLTFRGTTKLDLITFKYNLLAIIFSVIQLMLNILIRLILKLLIYLYRYFLKYLKLV